MNHYQNVPILYMDVVSIMNMMPDLPTIPVVILPLMVVVQIKKLLNNLKMTNVESVQ